MFGRHFLKVADVTPEELARILDVAKKLKALQKSGTEHSLLRGKSLAMIFQKPSTRTRVSFEMGMVQLGGNAVNIRPEEMQLGQREAVSDVARVMSRSLLIE